MWKSYYSIGEFWKNIINIVYTRYSGEGQDSFAVPFTLEIRKIYGMEEILRQGIGTD